MVPLLATSDFSNNETNLLTSSGFRGGTRMGPGAGCGLLAPASRGEGAAASTVIPSNLGNGPAIVRQHHAEVTGTSRNVANEAVPDCKTTYVVMPAHLWVRDQPERVLSTASRCQTQRESKAPCSPYPQFAISNVAKRIKPLDEIRLAHFTKLGFRHTNPRVSGGSLVFSKNGTAISPVITPRFVVSAA